MQSPAFPLAKIQAPSARPNLIEREALERRLGDALATRRLTLLSAPAGFGKTAALARQLARLPQGTAVAWIAADEDDDLHRFLVCLFAALEPFDLPWRADPCTLIAAAVNSTAERRWVSAHLLNALAACEVPRGLIAVDDAHRITDRSVFEFIDSLLDRLPPRWSLVIGCRVDPPLSLARLRGRDELAELRQYDLRFSPDEVAALVAAGGAGDATQLFRRTGGWPAGLRLMLNARSPARAALPALERTTDRHVFEYLAAEVLDDMPEVLRQFLLRCSVLPELTAGRCASVSGDARAVQWLEEIERRGLFVSVLDDAGPILALNELFRDFLFDRLCREHADELPELLRRAADSESDPIRRLSLLLRAGAVSEAAETLNAVAVELLAAGAIEPVLRLIEQFPPASQEHSPMLALVRGRAAWARWDWVTMAEAMQRASAGFAAAGDEAWRQRAQVFEAVAFLGRGLLDESWARLAPLSPGDEELEARVLTLALRAWHALDRGDFAAVAPRYCALLDVLEQTEGLCPWYQGFQRMLYVWLPNMRVPLSRLVDGLMQRTGSAPSQMRAVAHVMSAWLALWRGDLRSALDRLAHASDDARWLGWPAYLRMFVNTAAAALHAVRGERVPAFAAIDSLLGYFEEAPSRGAGRTSMLGHYLFYAARLADTLGDTAALRAFAAQMPPPTTITNADMLRPQLATLPARLAAHDGRHDEACALWEQALANEAAIDAIGLVQESHMRYAHALLAVGRRAEAAVTLRPVLHAAARDGEIGGVLLAGKAVLSDLACTPWGEELPWNELAMLRDWANCASWPAAPPTDGCSCGDGLQLSPRELEVLARIAAGDSNKLIARAFDLSPHTVKRHVANILDKLDLSSRGQAAEWYRAHTAQG